MCKIYHVAFKMHSADIVNYIAVKAKNKEDAYDLAMKQLPVLVGYPYSAWVSDVIYKDGSSRIFNNYEGKPY